MGESGPAAKRSRTDYDSDDSFDEPVELTQKPVVDASVNLSQWATQPLSDDLVNRPPPPPSTANSSGSRRPAQPTSLRPPPPGSIQPDRGQPAELGQPAGNQYTAKYHVTSQRPQPPVSLPLSRPSTQYRVPTSTTAGPTQAAPSQRLISGRVMMLEKQLDNVNRDRVKERRLRVDESFLHKENEKKLKEEYERKLAARDQEINMLRADLRSQSFRHSTTSSQALINNNNNTSLNLLSTQSNADATIPIQPKPGSVLLTKPIDLNRTALCRSAFNTSRRGDTPRNSSSFRRPFDPNATTGSSRMVQLSQQLQLDVDGATANDHQMIASQSVRVSVKRALTLDREPFPTVPTPAASQRQPSEHDVMDEGPDGDGVSCSPSATSSVACKCQVESARPGIPSEELALESILLAHISLSTFSIPTTFSVCHDSSSPSPFSYIRSKKKKKDGNKAAAKSARSK